MLISHRYKFIYLKTVKTAGTSVESYFERFCVPEGVVLPLEHSRDEHVSSAGIIGYRGRMRNPRESWKWWNHMPAWQVRKQIGEQIWNDYFKFCVVRNPFDKAISAFEHFGKDHVLTGRLWWLRLKHLGYNAEQLRFLDYVKRELPIDRDKYVIDSKFCLDAVLRFESLNEDLQSVGGRIGVPWEPMRMPRFKSQWRRQSATISNLYTPAAIQRVKEVYEFELEEFGYSFPKGTPQP